MQILDSIALTFRKVDEQLIRFLSFYVRTLGNTILLRPLFLYSLGHRSDMSTNRLMHEYASVPSAVCKFENFLYHRSDVTTNQCERMEVLRLRRIFDNFLWHSTDISRNRPGSHATF